MSQSLDLAAIKSFSFEIKVSDQADQLTIEIAKADIVKFAQQFASTPSLEFCQLVDLLELIIYIMDLMNGAIKLSTAAATRVQLMVSKPRPDVSIDFSGLSCAFTLPQPAPQN